MSHGRQKTSTLTRVFSPPAWQADDDTWFTMDLLAEQLRGRPRTRFYYGNIYTNSTPLTPTVLINLCAKPLVTCYSPLALR